MYVNFNAWYVILIGLLVIFFADGHVYRTTIWITDHSHLNAYKMVTQTGHATGATIGLIEGNFDGILGLCPRDKDDISFLRNAYIDGHIPVRHRKCAI
jgi:hypothetical protein